VKDVTAFDAGVSDVVKITSIETIPVLVPIQERLAIRAKGRDAFRSPPFAGEDPGGRERLAGGRGRHHRQRFIGSGVAAVADAGALDDPVFVQAGISGNVRVGHYPVRSVRSNTEDPAGPVLIEGSDGCGGHRGRFLPSGRPARRR
jgi:hypothetical protein